MASELIDIIRSLTAIMREETMRLQKPGRFADLGELAGAKTRLVAALDAKSAELARRDPDWLDALDSDVREPLMDALADMKDASGPNQAALKRQIELSMEMMAAIAAEAKRVTGARHAVYGAAGGLSKLELPAPISVNSQY